jgi:hypothetical protein
MSDDTLHVRWSVCLCAQINVPDSVSPSRTPLYAHLHARPMLSVAYLLHRAHRIRKLVMIAYTIQEPSKLKSCVSERT